ncbi:MAG: nucleotidyl transferase AbiEii/AbiGii toxin family protein [Tenuifilaceae bacterium]|jgi:predicted nucleotidyltransferase component of viral defense system|nr:nucleotidyl transferase AbiEii/AbiGii toxin family protein [Tenuifilaceae bacterium]
MIDKDKITLDWIAKISKENRNADRILVEKVIRALSLLEGLVKQKLSFVFKGGTALMLQVSSPKRLSIDIDIIMPVKPEKLDELLDGVASEQGFLRKELQQRTTDSKIDKAHYKFYYPPLHKTSQDEEFVLLDILFEEVQYKNLVDLKIQSSFVPEKESPLTVKSACLEDITGDKLTAFAPTTTGIPYFKGKDSMGMEIIKQLYDIGNLFDNVTDIETIKTTFKKFANTELEYRDLNTLTDKDVLEDIYQTSLCMVTRGADGKGNFDQLLLGIQRVSRFILSESYHIERAITHASKAAYVATLIRHDYKTIEKYSDPLQMKDWLIAQPINTKLNRLKKSNPEAFFYWYKIYELETN